VSAQDDRRRPAPTGKAGVEFREGGAVLLGEPPILKLEPDTSFVVVNAGKHPLDARTRELTAEAIAAMRDWCDARLGSMGRDGRPGRKPAKGGEGDA
jgi:hypothetical protein